jgi:hypothetical protein
VDHENAEFTTRIPRAGWLKTRTLAILRRASEVIAILVKGDTHLRVSRQDGKAQGSEMCLQAKGKIIIIIIKVTEIMRGGICYERNRHKARH